MTTDTIRRAAPPSPDGRPSAPPARLLPFVAGNAYRVLGLRAGASQREIYEAAAAARRAWRLERARATPNDARCLQLAADALAGARVAGADLDRILLVGGPTQMPFVRTTVGAEIGARVDFSLDPMTVVARGACLYGASVERRAVVAALASSPSSTPVVGPERVQLRLAYEAVSETLESFVAGVAGGSGAKNASQVKIEAANGYWQSGWHPLADGFFEIPVVLQEGRSCAFTLSVRDATGRELEVEPREFSIRHGLAFGAPPLPHTLSVEVTGADGSIELHPVFPRMTPLPAEKTVAYRAAQTLRPSEAETSLAIKLWEGEAFSEPQANHWVGNMHIRSEAVRRPVPEGAELQLHIRIDASRLITVEVFIPHLNEHFTERIYIPQEEEPDYRDLCDSVQTDLETYLARLDKLEERLLHDEHAATDAEEEEFPSLLFAADESPATEREYVELTRDLSPRRDVERLRREIEDLDIEIGLHRAMGGEPDPDAAKGLFERAREIRVRIANLERRTGINFKSDTLQDALRLASEIESEVEAYGLAAQRERGGMLLGELRRAATVEDLRGVRRALVSLKNLRREVLHAQEWFWRDWFEYFQRPGRRFVNMEEARRWLAHGQAATERNSPADIEQAVRRLWGLQPLDEQQADHERSIRPGLKL